jgi:serine protease inhibitor
MKVRFASFASLCSCLVLVWSTPISQGWGREVPPSSPNTSSRDRLVDSVNLFGFRLLEHVQSAQPAENILLSPIGISSAIAMALNGAAGRTAEGMRMTLGIHELTELQINQGFQSLLKDTAYADEFVKMAVANSIWIQEKLAVLPAFEDMTRTYFSSEVRRVNFSKKETLAALNQWTADKTLGRIQTVPGSTIDPTTAMIIVDAIYFSGQWMHAFDPQSTHDGRFTLGSGEKKSVRMMQHGDLSVPYVRTKEFEAVHLPYCGRTARMTLVLPGKKSATLREILKQSSWRQWVMQLKSHTGKVTIPRFYFEWSRQLKEALSAMGMGEAFAMGADLTRTASGKGLFIGNLDQATRIAVDERGTETTAETTLSTIMGMEQDMAKPFHFQANRPFYVVIDDVITGAILFIGKVEDPK